MTARAAILLVAAELEKMISLDLSKTPSVRLFVYLLALFPGLFFLLSVALGDPELARTAIKEIEGIHPTPSYVLLVLLLGCGLAIGEAFVLVAWIVQMVLANLYRASRAACRTVFRKSLGGPKVYSWFGNFQGMPPKQTRLVRFVGKMIFLARATGKSPSQDEISVRFCLSAATEKLLEKRYGIDPHRATGPTGREWAVWNDALGKPIKNVRETLNASRIVLACGLAGFLALAMVEALRQRYYIAMCLVFAFSGLWNAGYYFFLFRNPAARDFLRLQSVLLELQDVSETSPAEPGGEPG